MALWGVTMTLKKLAAGSGYQYLTRQVAAADSTELGRMALADYYSAKGEAPGLWLGRVSAASTASRRATLSRPSR